MVEEYNWLNKDVVLSLQGDVTPIADELGFEYSTLTEGEAAAIARCFNRYFTFPFAERDVASIYGRHVAEIILGAMVAKKQMGATVEGEKPGSNKIGGPIPIRAAFFGVGDDWEDASPFTTGSPQNWIHSGTTILGGTSGNPIKIGENALHVIIGVGSYHPSPKAESVQFYINGKPEPVIVTGPTFKKGLKIHELETARVLPKDTEFKARVFISAAYGSSADDYPYLLGVSFIKEPQMRLHDAANVVASTQKVVLTT